MIKKRVDYRHFICVGITIVSVLYAVFVFPNAFGRIIEAVRDLGVSVAYYFAQLLGIPHNIVPTVNNMPKIPFFDKPNVGVVPPSTPSVSIPSEWELFLVDFKRYWQVWASADNFSAYIQVVLQGIVSFSKIVLLLIPGIVMLYILLRRYLRKQNNDYDKDSRPLRVFKTVMAYTYHPVKDWLIGFCAFVAQYKVYRVIWLCIWAYNFNLLTIVVEFFAYYFYFAVSFDFVNIYRQIYKLCLDLWTPFSFIPVWAWVVILFLLFDWFRKKIAYARLNHFELRNRGFINSRPIILLTLGTMGTKKTTMITDVALSQEVLLKNKAFEKILENDMKFPYFPWINLENIIKKAMSKHEVYNLATCRKFIKRLMYCFSVAKACPYYAKSIRRHLRKCGYDVGSNLLFDYDYVRYGFTYNDDLQVVDVWTVIEIYAQLYFIYIIQSSLIISNYAIRTDLLLSDLGNFPIWNTDFFKRDSRLIDSFSRHSHIIDFDALRLGKKMIENNPLADFFEFGVLDITEIGKERKNMLELQGMKKLAESINQKNDGFNDWLKMVRHSATVDNFPFVKVISDEQRSESLGADVRQLCDLVNIQESGDKKLAMPFFTFAELLYDLVLGKFTTLYYKYRYKRADNTLIMYLLKGMTAKIHHYYTRIYNRFGYCILRVIIENGLQTRVAENKYYLCSKKIYSKRFSTDCFSDFFTEKALRSAVGIEDLREYASEKATFAELELQNSYFVNDLLSGMKR